MRHTRSPLNSYQLFGFVLRLFQSSVQHVVRLLVKALPTKHHATWACGCVAVWCPLVLGDGIHHLLSINGWSLIEMNQKQKSECWKSVYHCFVRDLSWCQALFQFVYTLIVNVFNIYMNIAKYLLQCVRMSTHCQVKCTDLWHRTCDTFTFLHFYKIIEICSESPVWDLGGYRQNVT